jgi:hypothetical protein
MGLRDLQISSIVDKIINQELEAGVSPHNKTLANLLNEHFRENGYLPGEPSLQIKEAISRSDINSKEYNEMLDRIEDDLNLLYGNLLRQNKLIVDNFTNFENEKEKTINEVSELNSRADRILKKANNTNPYNYSVTENFSNFMDIDMDKTSTYIDLKNNEVALPYIQSLTENIPLNNASINIRTISPKQEIGNKKELSSVSNAINSFINEVWQHKVELNKEKRQQTIEINLNIKLSEKKNISQIQITPCSPQKTFITLKYLNKDGQFEVVEGINNFPLENKHKWNFNTITTDNFRLTLTKHKPDYSNNKDYSFGIANIIMSKSKYKKKATLETKPLKAGEGLEEFVLDKIKLETEEEIPSNTSIDYYIKYGTDPDNLSSRQHINPDKPEREDEDKLIDLGSTSDVEQVFTAPDSSDFVELTDFSTDYCDYYRYGPLELNSIGDTIKVYHGNNLWLKEVYQDTNQQYIKRAASITDWTNVPDNSRVISDYIDDDTFRNGSETLKTIVETATPNATYDKYYLNCNDITDVSVDVIGSSETPTNIDNDNGTIEFGTSLGEDVEVKASYKANKIFYKFTTWMYFDEPTTYKTDFINFPDNATLPREVKEKAYHTTFYLNSAKVYKREISSSGVDQYQYVMSFKEGWNKMTLVAYIHDKEKLDILTGGISATTVGCDEYRVYKEPMNQISFYKLKNQIKPTNNQYYSVKELNVEDEIRHYVVLNNDNKDGYIVKYKYPTRNAEAEDYYVKLIAELSSDKGVVTPRVKQFKLNFFN